MQLPVYIHKRGLLKKSVKVVVTTLSQLPKKKYGRTICMAQPHHIAAIAFAKHILEEINCIPGTILGHRVRFNNMTNLREDSRTKIIYATNGMLLRESITNPLLKLDGMIALDEAHKCLFQMMFWLGV